MTSINAEIFYLSAADVAAAPKASWQRVYLGNVDEPGEIAGWYYRVQSDEAFPRGPYASEEEALHAAYGW